MNVTASVLICEKIHVTDRNSAIISCVSSIFEMHLNNITLTDDFPISIPPLGIFVKLQSDSEGQEAYEVGINVSTWNKIPENSYTKLIGDTVSFSEKSMLSHEFRINTSHIPFAKRENRKIIPKTTNEILGRFEVRASLSQNIINYAPFILRYYLSDKGTTDA